jgi:hypothetical protein
MGESANANSGNRGAWRGAGAARDDCYILSGFDKGLFSKARFEIMSHPSNARV